MHKNSLASRETFEKLFNLKCRHIFQTPLDRFSLPLYPSFPTDWRGNSTLDGSSSFRLAMVEPRKCIIDRMWILIFFDHRCYCFAIFAIVSSFVASMDSTSEALPGLLLREIKIRVFFCSGDTHLCCLYFCTAVPAEPFWNAVEIIPGGSNQLWNLHLLYGRNMSSRMKNW